MAMVYRPYLSQVTKRITYILNPNYLYERDDLVQDTFTAAFRTWDNFRGDAAISTWLEAIARNKTFSWLKKEKKRDFILFDPTDCQEDEQPPHWYKSPHRWTDPHVRLWSSEIALILRNIPRSRAPRYYMELLEMQLSGMSRREIAVAINKPEDTTRFYLFQARKVLSTILVDSGITMSQL